MESKDEAVVMNNCAACYWEEKDNERKSPMDLCSLEIPLGSYFGSRALNVKKGRISDVW